MKDIMLRIVGRQINRNNEVEDESIEFVTRARAYRKKDAIYVDYDESEIDGLSGHRATLRIGDDGNIKLKRFDKDDIINNEMEFIAGQRFINLYDTPAGSLPMELLTNSIDNRIDTEQCTGSLFIDYDIALRGLLDARNLLNIEISDVPDGPEFDNPHQEIFGTEQSTHAIQN